MRYTLPQKPTEFGGFTPARFAPLAFAVSLSVILSVANLAGIGSLPRLEWYDIMASSLTTNIPEQAKTETLKKAGLLTGLFVTQKIVTITIPHTYCRLAGVKFLHLTSERIQRQLHAGAQSAHTSRSATVPPIAESAALPAVPSCTNP